MEPHGTLDSNGIVKENSKKKIYEFKVKLLKNHPKMMMNLAAQTLT